MACFQSVCIKNHIHVHKCTNNCYLPFFDPLWGLDNLILDLSLGETRNLEPPKHSGKAPTAYSARTLAPQETVCF